MKTQLFVVTAFVAMLAAFSTQAREFDPGEKIQVACAGDTMPMTAITGAVANSHRWASQTVRVQMLSRARRACARGATAVTFLPPEDERSCHTPPTWSDWCIDQPAAKQEAMDSLAGPMSPAQQ